MGRVFQTSTPRRGYKSGTASLPSGSGMKVKHADDKQRDKKANYLSFYNVQKTKLSARYPFLPTNQIERRIKHLWANASAKRKSSFCASLSGTTAVKSPFRGVILKGLCKRTSFSPGFKDVNSRPDCQASPLASSPSNKHHGHTSHGILRNSEKKRTSMARVSFRLQADSMPSPIPAFHQTKRSLINGYLTHSDTKNGEFESKLDEGGEGHQDTATAQKEIVCEQAGKVQGRNDVASTVDVNTSVSAPSSVNTIPGQQTPGKCEKNVCHKSEEIYTGLMDLHLAEKTSRPPTCTRRSKRAAAIVAKAKIKSPHIKGSDKKIGGGTKSGLKKESCNTNILHRLKRTELSLEEKKVYEFEDDASSVNSVLDSHLQGKSAKIIGADTVSRNPEEYNLDSHVNTLVFDEDSSVPFTAQPSECQNKDNKCQQKTESRPATVKRRGRPRKGDVSTGNQTSILPSKKSSYRKGRPKMVMKSEKSQSLSALKDRDTESKVRKAEDRQLYAGEEHVPWLVSACPSSSDNDSADDFDDEGEDGAIYQHYQLDSENSSAPLSTPESHDLVSSSKKVCDGFESFCRSSFCSTKELGNSQIPNLDFLVPSSPQSSELSSSSSSACDAQVSSSQDDVVYSGIHALMSVCPGSSDSVASDNLVVSQKIYAKPHMLSRKHRMRLETGEFSESSQASEGEESSPSVKEALCVDKLKYRKGDKRNKKRKQEDLSEAFTPAREEHTDTDLGDVRQKSKRGRMTAKLNGGTFSNSETQQENRMQGQEDESLLPKSSDQERRTSTGDGILCDLFNTCSPNQTKNSRVLNPGIQSTIESTSEEPLPSDSPVSCPLFLEENFFS